MGPVEKAPFRNSFDDLTVHLYNLKTSAQFDLYDAGRTVHISAMRRDHEIVVQLSEAIAGLRLCLQGCTSVRQVEGASDWNVAQNDVMITVTDTTVRILLGD
jgi:hypothetical protein